jgi:hypothetical protein
MGSNSFKIAPMIFHKIDIFSAFGRSLFSYTDFLMSLRWRFMVSNSFLKSSFKVSNSFVSLSGLNSS